MDLEPGSILARLEEIFTHHHKQLEKEREANRFTTWYHGANASTDAAGNINDLPLGEVVPVGKILRIYRIIIWADGYDPGNAFTDANSWVGFYNGPGANPGTLEDFSPESAGSQVFPSRASYNKTTAPEFRGGERVYVNIFDGPPSVNINISARGRLENHERI